MIHRFVAGLLMVIGVWMLRASARIGALPDPDSIAVLSGDSLSLMGDIVGVPRPLDKPYRKRLLHVVQNVGRA